VLDNAFHGAKTPGQGFVQDRWQGSKFRSVPVKLDDANFVEQGLCSLGAQPSILHRLEQYRRLVLRHPSGYGSMTDLQNGFSHASDCPLLVVNDWTTHDWSAALLTAPPEPCCCR
jgi:hypothetical protein